MTRGFTPLTLAVAACLSGCNGVPLATQWKLRSYDLSTADVAPLRVALRAPDWLEPTPASARVVATYWRDGEEEARHVLTIFSSAPSARRTLRSSLDRTPPPPAGSSSSKPIAVISPRSAPRRRRRAAGARAGRKRMARSILPAASFAAARRSRRGRCSSTSMSMRMMGSAGCLCSSAMTRIRATRTSGSWPISCRLARPRLRASQSKRGNSGPIAPLSDLAGAAPPRSDMILATLPAGRAGHPSQCTATSFPSASKS